MSKFLVQTFLVTKIILAHGKILGNNIRIRLLIDISTISMKIQFHGYNEYPQGRPEASDDRFLSKTFSNFQLTKRKT